MNMQEVVVAVQNGLEFKEMEVSDYHVFGGAPEGALIAYTAVAVYILKGNELKIITQDFETQYSFEMKFEVEL